MCNSINTPIIRGVVTSDDFGVLRLVFIENEVLFCGRDVATAFGFKDCNKAISYYCCNVNRIMHETSSGKQFLNFISFCDALNLFKHSKNENTCEYVIFLKDMRDSFIIKVINILNQNPVPKKTSCEYDESDTDTEKALDDFVEKLKELHENHGIFVSIEGIYLDEGEERYRLV